MHEGNNPPPSARCCVKHCAELHLLFGLDWNLVAVPTFCPSLSFATCAEVNTNDVHGSCPLITSSGIYIFCAGTFVRVQQARHIRTLVGKKLCSAAAVRVLLVLYETRDSLIYSSARYCFMCTVQDTAETAKCWSLSYNFSCLRFSAFGLFFCLLFHLFNV